MKFTACYVPIDAGYMGKLLEWPEVVTEGATLDECREMLTDAAQEMAVVYQEDGMRIPHAPVVIEPLSVEIREAALANVG